MSEFSAAWSAFMQAKAQVDNLPHGRDATPAQRETYFDAIEAMVDARDEAVAAFVRAHDGTTFAAPTIPWPGAKPSFIVVHQDAHGWRISRFDGTIARPRGATGHGYRGSYADAVRDAVRDDRADLGHAELNRERVSEMREAALTKPGNHGTLHYYLLRYKDKYDEASPVFEWRTWAYSSDHALDKFYDSDDEGWKVISWELVQDSAQHRAKRHEMREAPSSAEFHVGDDVAVSAPHGEEHGRIVGPSRQTGVVTLQIDFGGTVQPFRRDKEGNWRDPGGSKVQITVSGGMREAGDSGAYHPGSYLPVNIGETSRFSAHGANFLVKYHSRNTFVLSTDPPGQRRRWGTRDQIMKDIAYVLENGALPAPRSGSMTEASHGHVSATQARAVGDRLGVDWRHVPFEEFRKGLGVELEHSDITGGDLLKTAKIVLAHLAETDDYYARLDLVGLEPR